jgi:tape measure domain-containing protein
MTVEIASLTTTHKVDLRDLKRNFQEAERLTQGHVGKLNSMLSGVGSGSGRGILSGIASVAGGNILTSMFNSITGAMTGAVKAGFEWNKLNEQTAIGFKVMLKDGNKALAFMQQLQAFAKESSLDLPGAYEGAQRLMAMGFEAKEVIPLLRAAADAAAGLGKVGGAAAAKVDQITLALGQMRAKGKVSAEEMSQQLVEAGIPAWRYLGDEIARTDKKFAKFNEQQRAAAVMKMAERGQLNARTAVAVIQRGMETDFGGMGKQISQETAGGLESQIGDDTDRLLGQATAPAFGKYKKLLRTTLDAINSDAANSIVGGVSSGTGALLDALEVGIKAAATGDVMGALGLDSVTKFVGGVKDNLVQAVNAGSSIVQSAVSGGEKEQAHASARWSEMGKQAGSKYFAAFAQGKGIAQPQQDGMMGVKTRTGETFQDLADRYRVSVEALIEANRRLADEIVATGQLATTGRLPGGRVLQIPGSSLPGGRNKASRRGVSNLDQWEPLIQENATRFDVDPNLIRAMMSQESGGIKGATSPKGARGLMQLMPATARSLGVKDITDPAQNIMGGVKYMAQLLKEFNGDIKLALAGYNAGEGAVHKYGNQIPPYKETQAYVSRIMANYGAMPLRGQGGLSTSEKAELETARSQVTILQKSIDAYNARLAGQSLHQLNVDPKTTGIWTNPNAAVVNVPTWGNKGERANLIEDDLLQQKMVRKVDELQARVRELESRQASGNASFNAPADAPFGFSNVSSEQAKGVLDIFSRARAGIIETSGTIDNMATEVVPRGLKAIQLPALAIEKAYQNLEPLVNKVSMSMEQRLGAIQDRLPKLNDEVKGIVADLPEGIGNIFGGAVQQWDGTFRGFLDGLKQGVAQTLQDISAQLIRSSVTKLLVNLGLSLFGGAVGGLGGGGSTLSPSGQSVPNWVFKFATGGMIAPQSGGRLVQLAEGGYAEMVLSTDPKHKGRTAQLMGDFIKRTQTIPRLAMGDWVTPEGGLPGLSSLSVSRDYNYSPDNSRRVSNQYGPQKQEVHNHHYSIVVQGGGGGGYTQPRAQDALIKNLAREIDRTRRR